MMTDEEIKAALAGIKPPRPQYLKEIFMIRKDKQKDACPVRIEQDKEEKKE
jgi:hypothetical protein